MHEGLGSLSESGWCVPIILAEKIEAEVKISLRYTVTLRAALTT